jgi:YfiH family protein
MAHLQRIVASNEVVVYRSQLLAAEGFRHGFSTRHGGVSAVPFDSMNLGIAQAPGEPDSEANILENARRLMEAIGAPGLEMVRVRQVHECAVFHCRGDERFGTPTIAADAVLASDGRVAPCIRTADCVPILVACTESGTTCAIHAGWRGIVAGVVPEAIRAMCAVRGTRAGSMIAAIGPCIGRDVYEVGADVAGQFAGAVGAAFVLPAIGSRRKEHIDCFGAVREQLRASGVPLESIDGEELCTVATPREFFSYRRDGARSGRMAAVIAPRG